jgi:hypothetical protein
MLRFALASLALIALPSVAAAQPQATAAPEQATPPAPAPPPAAPAASSTTPAPTRDEILRVVEYFDRGKGQGPVLLELTPCLKIDKPEGERKKRCVEPITAKVQKRTTAYVFLRFLVPRDDRYDDITVEWTRDGEVVGTSAVSVATSWSYGVWKARALTRAGKWTVSVRRGDAVLDKADIIVE